jgi:hypothetical protein
LLLRPSRHSQRIVAQAGWHTVHSFYGREDNSLGGVSMNESARDREQLTIIEINPTSIQLIRNELSAMGIEAATVYGDLTSVCTELQNNAGVSPGMRRDLPYLEKRRHESQVHVLGLLLANLRGFRVGDTFRCVSEDSGNCRTCDDVLITQELFDEAKVRANLYAHRFPPPSAS